MKATHSHQDDRRTHRGSLRKRIVTVVVAVAALGVLPVGVAGAVAPAAEHPVAAAAAPDTGRDIPGGNDDRTRDRQRDQRQERRAENMPTDQVPIIWNVPLN
ncbi:hypothetical protein [Rhodococcus sp. JS3073]|uniref:hypothetical protein n=1 Tax=Rhodococcus sp. JS3073 TaxID=3002901 RepID=UPI002285DF8C|nr:hypothetical protein [Rhodococcus sp. JS3073]WAM18449.1 hypothetical protein OYT95_18060 [Rhodococcus sp. JS3073]